MKPQIFSSLFLTLAAIIGNSCGDNLTTFGSEFYLGFYEHVHTAYTHQFYVHTLKTSTVNFKVTSLDNQFTYSGSCTRNSPATVNIPFSYEVRGNDWSYRKKGLRITSLETDPISIITWSYRSSADYMAYMAYPCHVQPTKNYIYYAISSSGWSNQKSMFLLVGCHDDTTVTINSKANIVVPVNAQLSGSSTKTVTAGQNYTLTLHSLQTFLVYVAYADLTASKIISDHPLTVISGHEAAQVPTGVFDADPTSTQLIPTTQWGKTFMLSPHTGRTKQNYRIMADEDDTSISINCGTNTLYTYTVSGGNWKDFYTNGNTYCSVESSKPIYIAQQAVSSSSGGNGDPCLNTIASIEQYTNTIQLTTLSASYHYYSVVMPNDDYYTGQIKYDGNTQTKSFTKIYYKNGTVAGYGYSSSVSGSHTIAHPNENGKLFVSIYGWTTYGGYCYDSGMRLNAINSGSLLPQISFTKSEYLVKENNGTVNVYLERSKQFDSDVSVNFTVAPAPADTAESGVDYAFKSETVTFEGDETLKVVVVTILDDLLSEKTEYFTVKIEPIDEDVTFPLNEAVVGIEDNDDVLECDVKNGGCEQNCTNTFEGSYCSCYTNYTLNSNNQTCDPVCSDKCGNCLTCDSPGQCSCIGGWKGSDCCVDKDECDINNAGCEQNCHNNDGSYYCSCNQGYKIDTDDHHSCNDIDECEAGTDGCNHHCTNSIGSYLCYCDTGYELHENQKTCEDTDECVIDNGGCAHVCTNNIGSYVCSCNNGYDLDPNDKHSCNDINECDLTVSCEHECFNTNGSFTCDCNIGYQLNSDGQTCQDTDECSDDNGGCFHLCVNEVGSYHCECNDGFTLDDDGHGCSDHDECLSNTHVCEQNCHNSHGTYSCSCKTGYRLAPNNRTCDEIDECAEFISGCNQICQNFIGGYSCDCYTGFSLSDDDHTCEDINECDYKNGNCDLNCTNTVGSFYCACADGYTLNDDYRCEDVDECAAENKGGCASFCTNTVGSYRCSCHEGFQLADDLHGCDDVDECLSRRCEHRCVNQYGSFYCECDDGFELTDKLFCADIDECATGVNKCTQNCFNRLATYYCTCNPGYYLDTNDNYTCIDIDECATNTSKCQQLCNNTVGSYFCSCKDEYYLGQSGFDCLKNETDVTSVVGKITSTLRENLAIIIPAAIIIIALIFALLIAIIWRRKKQTDKSTFKPGSKGLDQQRPVDMFGPSTTNPLYMNMEDEDMKEDFVNDEHIYESTRGFDQASVTDTITDSMIDYCDQEKLVAN